MTQHESMHACVQVLASYGHVRDLPAKAGSVLPEADFEMRWQQSAAQRPRLKELAAALRSAGRLVLATDPRQGGRGHLLARDPGAAGERVCLKLCTAL